MGRNEKRLFCDINPTCYAISMQKKICRQHVTNLLSQEKYAKIVKKEKLPNLVYDHSSYMIKKGKGINPEHQINKVHNIILASSKMDGIIIRPGEVFSFWNLVGKVSRKKGYKDGRVLQRNKLIHGTGGGLCNLANTIHILIVHSPLDVVEFHAHSDALAPDAGKRVPLSAGTSVSYNYIDYRFKNNTDQDFQLLLWCEEDTLYAELRSERELLKRYQLIEENHHFKKEGDKYYRVSKIYREVIDNLSGTILGKELVLDNHSEVMFDYDLIPKDQIRED